MGPFPSADLTPAYPGVCPTWVCFTSLRRSASTGRWRGVRTVLRLSLAQTPGSGQRSGGHSSRGARCVLSRYLIVAHVSRRSCPAWSRLVRPQGFRS